MSVASTDRSSAVNYAKLVLVAARLGTGTYSQPQFDEISALNFTFIEEIKGNDLPGDAVSFGYVALAKQSSDASGQSISAGECIVAIRGTHATDILEWLDDAVAVLIPTRLGMVHAGFWSVYDSLRLVQQPSANKVTVAEYVRSLFATGQASSITIAGHSLGASLATLLALEIADLKPRVRTFASPRTGDKDFADKFNKSVLDSERYEHHVDVVPMLPAFPFWHVGQKMRLNGDTSLSVAENHLLTTYIELLEKS